MKVLRILLAVSAIASLTACGGSTAKQSTSSVAETSAPLATPDCSQEALDATSGRKGTYVLGCSGNWAAVESPYIDECTEHCFAFIYKWDQAKWNLTMKCDQYSTLSAEGFCMGLTGEMQNAEYIDTIAEFPPQDVACQIFPPNRSDFNVAITGCTPDPAS
jgi:hypothetical protein